MRSFSVMRCVLGVGLGLMVQGCAAGAGTGTAVPHASLSSVIDSVTVRPPLQRTSWGILVADAETGRVLYAQNPERHFIPASNQKLVVSVVALGKLGPEFRYRTPLLLGARSADSAASLIIAGSGDPTWSARFHDDVMIPLDSMAALVTASGVRAIGTLIVDVSEFTDELVNSTWEVGDLPYSSAPPIDAVVANDGVFSLIVTGGLHPGDSASARIDGPLTQPLGVQLTTDTAGARTRLDVDYTARRDTIYITGSVAAGAADTSTLALTQPARSTGEALAGALRMRGVAVDTVMVLRDSAAAAAARNSSVEIAEWVSPPLRDIVAVILRPSQNWVAEQVLKTLGAEYADDGSWRSGIALEREYLYTVAGIDSGSVNLRDASGMSAQNLLSPEATVGILLHARAQPWSDVFRDALASPGLEGSTLSRRLEPLEGRVFGKTGTISNVNSLSGYLVARDGRDIVFSILSNGSGLPSGIVRRAIDEIVLAVAREVDAR